MKELLEKAKHEIIQLRRQNEILGAQLDVVHVFAVALGLKRHEQGMTIDIVWELNKEIDKLQKDNTEKEFFEKIKQEPIEVEYHE